MLKEEVKEKKKKGTTETFEWKFRILYTVYMLHCHIHP